MSYTITMQIGRVIRDRLPDYLQQQGFSIQMLNDDDDSLEMRCIRDQVRVRLCAVRKSKERFELKTEPEPGFKFWLGPASIRMAEAIHLLIQQMPLDYAGSSVSEPVSREPQTQWLVARGGKTRGPLSWARLRELAAEGKLRGDDMLQEQGSPKNTWKRADSVVGLFRSAEPATTETAPARPPTARPKVQLKAPLWMFVVGVAILGIAVLTPLLLMRPQVSLSEDAKLGASVGVVVVSLLLLTFLTIGIERRTRQPFKSMREVAKGVFCVGALFLAMSSIFRVATVQGGETYAILGPQTTYDMEAMYYGLAMMLLGVVSFLIPHRLSLMVMGVGIALGGLLQMIVAVMAMLGKVQLRGVMADGMGTLMQNYPVLPLLFGIGLVLGGIGCFCWACRKKLIEGV